jgi:hypothetical protein
VLENATEHARCDRFRTLLEEVVRQAVGDEEARARLIVIAYGAGKFLSTLRHNQHVPITRLRRETHCRVVLVDEHQMSSFHYGAALQLLDICRASDGRYVTHVM